MVQKALTKLLPGGAAAPVVAPLESLCALGTEQLARAEARERARLEFEAQLVAFEEAEANIEARRVEQARFHAVWMEKTQVHHQALLQHAVDHEAYAQALEIEAARRPELARPLRREARRQEALASATREQGLEHVLEQIEGLLRYTERRGG